MHPLTAAIVYAVVVMAVLPLGFAVFKTNYDFLDVVLAAVVGAALSLIPTIGGVASLVGSIGILGWRLSKDVLIPDVVVSLFVARLAVIPVLLLVART
jgi:hypothetical protein